MKTFEFLYVEKNGVPLATHGYNIDDFMDGVHGDRVMDHEFSSMNQE